MLSSVLRSERAVGLPNRDNYFKPAWSEIEVEIEGEVYRFALTAGFWKQCPEFRDRGSPVIREWLRMHHTLNWPKGRSPQFDSVPVEGNRFRLVSPSLGWDERRETEEINLLADEANEMITRRESVETRKTP